jgi:hypothetical protein
LYYGLSRFWVWDYTIIAKIKQVSGFNLEL